MSAAGKYLFKFTRNVAGIFFLPCFIITLLLWLKPPEHNIFSKDFSYEQYTGGKPTQEFIVSKPNSLMRLDLLYPVNNAWGEFEISICKGSAKYFTAIKAISYYSGAGWSEGSTKSSVYFKLPEKGKYHLKMHFEGGSGSYGGGGREKNKFTCFYL